MSLIDDALKRAQEASEKKGGAPKERPWVPAPLPDPAIARRRRAMRMAGLALAAAVVIAGGVWAVRVAGRIPAGKPDEKPPAAAAAAPAVLPTPEPTLVAVEVPPQAAAPARRPTRLPRLTPLVDTEGLNEGAETKVPAPGAPPERSGRVHAGFFTLPSGTHIELGGIVWSDVEPRALVNDKIVGVGAYIEGYSLTKIEEDRITLEKDGATVVITVK